MRSFGKLLYIACLVLSINTLSFAQSLGDVAREQRQKQQDKKAQSAPKVITNEDLPEHSDAADDVPSDQPSPDNTSSEPTGSKSAEQWKSEIEAQKRSVENLQSQMEKLNASIHFAPGNCVRNCVQWNERQVQKQDEVQRMQSDLDQQKKKLDDMQDGARKAGFGNSVYEP
jgi:Tfp pilus assembly protein PilV